MGSVLSYAHAALCSFVDKLVVRRMMAGFQHPPGMTTEEVEAAVRRFRQSQRRECEDPDPRPAAPPPRPGAFTGLRCNYRHPRYRVGDKSKEDKLAA